MKTDSNGYRILLALQGAGGDGMTTAELVIAAAVKATVVSTYTSVLVKRTYVERLGSGRYTITAGGIALIAAGGVEPRASKRKAKGATKKRKPAANKKPAGAAFATSVKKSPAASGLFRCGIFNDFGLEIRGKNCTGELDPEEAAALAGFCAQHFAAG